MELNPVEYPQPTVVPSLLEHIEVEAAVDCPTASEGPRALEQINIDNHRKRSFRIVWVLLEQIQARWTGQIPE